MIYDSLRTLPKIVQIEIMQQKNIFLLDTEYQKDKELDYEYSQGLVDTWNRLDDEYRERFDKANNDKTQTVLKEIEYLENKYKVIQFTLDSLYFTKSDELIALLESKEYGYKINHDKYDESLEQIDRESQAIQTKINAFKKTLPQPKESDKGKEKNYVDELLQSMAAISSTLGIDFDFYTVSVEKYEVLDAQAVKKVKALEKLQSKQSSSKK